MRWPATTAHRSAAAPDEHADTASPSARNVVASTARPTAVTADVVSGTVQDLPLNCPRMAAATDSVITTCVAAKM